MKYQFLIVCAVWIQNVCTAELNKTTNASAPAEEKNACNPSVCGLYANCSDVNGTSSCVCLPNYVKTQYGCRPECILNADCPREKSCRRNKCVDTCPGTCGINSDCQIINHIPRCLCKEGYKGNFFTNCVAQGKFFVANISTTEVKKANPCDNSPCGLNAKCTDSNGTASCVCLPNYKGDPYKGCNPECYTNNDCSSDKACIASKCGDPCLGTCGVDTICQIINHLPSCTCKEGYTGDPLLACKLLVGDPCDPSPCGPNTDCINHKGNPICMCFPDYFGDPFVGCRQECELNLECSNDKACLRNKCVDPCRGTCGENTNCQVLYHSPVCACNEGYTGDPFVFCRLQEVKENIPILPSNPCEPSPCGPNSACRVTGNFPVCSCLPGYIGSPPNCRPECTISSECSQTSACINQTCVDPCSNICAVNAVCQVINHSPICLCRESYTGDPFTKCFHLTSLEPVENELTDVCDPSLCGPYSNCENVNNSAYCSCLPNYIGRPPYCRPECTIDSDCSNDLACIKTKCDDSCPGACGPATECRVIKHSPICNCFEGYAGDPYSYCQPKLSHEGLIKIGPCNPSPCGSNADCDDGICTCKPGYIGDAYRECRPECVLNSDCPKNRACGDNKCIDPCVGRCAKNSDCVVDDHIVLCACKPGYFGSALVECTKISAPARPPGILLDPCEPTPCGPNSKCSNINAQVVCSCMSGFIGSPPNCRPECVTNSDCTLDKACINKKCKDPCEETCGENAICEVSRHIPICSCPPNLVGNPFVGCIEKVGNGTAVLSETNPCEPSPCGPNSTCELKEKNPSCSCLPNFTGSPPNCRPECITSSECSDGLSCLNNTCKNPCLNICGQNADCTLINKTPFCTCQPGYTGDPFSVCRKTHSELPVESAADVNPCNPSPCGANTECTPLNEFASCRCLNGYIGDPSTGCKPECVLNSDCAADKFCARNKCVDPCLESCGENSECTVINHLPVCSCMNGYTGNPFVHCNLISDMPKV